MPEPGGAEEPEAPAAGPDRDSSLGAARPFLFHKGLRRDRGAQEQVALRPGGHSWTSPTHGSVYSSRTCTTAGPQPRGRTLAPPPTSTRGLRGALWAARRPLVGGQGLGQSFLAPPGPCCFRASAVAVSLPQAYIS